MPDTKSHDVPFLNILYFICYRNCRILSIRQFTTISCSRFSKAGHIFFFTQAKHKKAGTLIFQGLRFSFNVNGSEVAAYLLATVQATPGSQSTTMKYFEMFWAGLMITSFDNVSLFDTYSKSNESLYM